MADRAQVEEGAFEICEAERVQHQKFFKVSGSKEKQARAIVSVSPFRCRVWALHDRLDDYVTEESCRAEIESFAAHGQLVPALGRPVWGDVSYDVEIVYGARRLFVARHLGIQLKVKPGDDGSRGHRRDGYRESASQGHQPV